MSDGPIDVKSCQECLHLHCHYDWDHDTYYCRHPDKYNGYIGLDTITPHWCPYLKEVK